MNTVRLQFLAVLWGLFLNVHCMSAMDKQLQVVHQSVEVKVKVEENFGSSSKIDESELLSHLGKHKRAENNQETINEVAKKRKLNTDSDDYLSDDELNDEALEQDWQKKQSLADDCDEERPWSQQDLDDIDAFFDQLEDVPTTAQIKVARQNEKRLHNQYEQKFKDFESSRNLDAFFKIMVAKAKKIILPRW